MTPAPTPSLSQTINDLKSRGYVVDFNVRKNRAESSEKFPEDFEVDKTYRFDVQTDPDDQAVLYAVSSHSKRTKGLIVNGFGIYSDASIDQIINKLSKHRSHQ